jgi:hypothetical protein
MNAATELPCPLSLIFQKDKGVAYFLVMVAVAAAD